MIRYRQSSSHGSSSGLLQTEPTITTTACWRMMIKCTSLQCLRGRSSFTQVQQIIITRKISPRLLLNNIMFIKRSISSLFLFVSHQFKCHLIMSSSRYLLPCLLDTCSEISSTSSHCAFALHFVYLLLHGARFQQWWSVWSNEEYLSSV